MRRSMLALIERGQSYEAQPAFWAPFVVVGEGGAPSEVAAVTDVQPPSADTSAAAPVVSTPPIVEDRRNLRLRKRK